eukprot:gene24143-30869_t
MLEESENKLNFRLESSLTVTSSSDVLTSARTSGSEEEEARAAETSSSQREGNGAEVENVSEHHEMSPPVEDRLQANIPGHSFRRGIH